MELHRVNLNLLVSLDLLLAAQSVSVAAQKAFVTQSAMSNNLSQLRQLLKDELLLRDKNKMVLTPFARELKPKLHQILQEMQSLISTNKSFDPKTSEREFRVGISDYMASLLLPDLMSVLARQAPKIRISIASTMHLARHDLEEGGNYEIGVGKLDGGQHAFEKELLFSDRILVLMSKNHRFASKKSISLKEYCEEQHVAIHVDSMYFQSRIEPTLAKLGCERNIKVSFPFVNPIFKMIESSPDLISSITESMARLYQPHHAFVTKPLPFELSPAEFFVVWHKRVNADLGLVWLRQQIVNAAKKLCSKKGSKA